MSTDPATEPEAEDFLLGFCYAEHDPPKVATEKLRLHFPGREPREVAACPECAAVLRMMAL